MSHLAPSLISALERYGHHPIGCPRWSGKVACTCGLDDVLKNGTERQLFDALKQYGAHDFLCPARGRALGCTCGLDTALEIMPSPKAKLVKVGPRSITVEVEETILLPEKKSAQLPAARVVALSWWQPYFVRGLLSGAIGTVVHVLLHWAGW